MDIQLVFNHYKAITYMCSYLSKQEDACSQAKEAIEDNLDNYQQMTSVAPAYSSKKECSVQESVCRFMPELWLRKIFPGVIYANSNLPEKRMKMILNENEITELHDDSTDLYKRNMVDPTLIDLLLNNRIILIELIESFRTIKTLPISAESRRKLLSTRRIK